VLFLELLHPHKGPTADPKQKSKKKSGVLPGSVLSVQKATLSHTVNKCHTRKASESETDTESGSESGDSMSVDYDVLDDNDMEEWDGLKDEDIGDKENVSPFGDKNEPEDDGDMSPSDIIKFMMSGDTKGLDIKQHDDGSLFRPISGTAEGLSSLDEELGQGKRKQKQALKAEQYHFWYN
jgi:hypothetical protein